MNDERRKIQLVAFDVDKDKYGFMSVSNGSLLAAIQRSNHADIGFFSPTSQVPERPTGAFVEDQAQCIMNSFADARDDAVDIAFGVFVWNDLLVRSVIARLRAHGCHRRIIVGGPQITWAPAGELEKLYPDVDVFLRGEAEESFVAVTKTADRVHANGVHYRGEKDSGSRATADLMRLPSPFFGDPFPAIPFERTLNARWETKRGCPYACSFCQHRGSGESPRLLENERLTKEIRAFVQHGVRLLTVVDPIFNVGPNYLRILKTLNEEGYRGRLSLQCRFEALTDEFLDAVAPFKPILEFGLQTAAGPENQAIDRHNNLKKVSDGMNKLRQRGLHFEVDLIYGLPAQTLASFQQSVKFCQENEVPRIRAWPFMLLRGTGLASEASVEKWGFRQNDDPIPLVTESNTFSHADWLGMRELAESISTPKLTEAEWESN